MTFAFFSARKLQHSYFEKLSLALQEKGHESIVLWHKALLWNPAWLLYLFKAPPDISPVIKHWLNEKQNSPKHKTHSKLYWLLFSSLKSIEARFLLAIYTHALAASKAQTMVIWNGLKYKQSIAVLAAEYLQLQCIYLENGLIPNATTVDSKGINFLNSVPRDPAFFDEYATTHGLTEKKKETVSTGGHYFFVPFQVNTDTQITRFSPWIQNMEGLVNAFTSASEELGDKMPDIIFKPHPASNEDISALQEKLEGYPALSIIEEGNTLDLVKSAKGVITINSTVGIEALLDGKPLVVLGNAFYAMDGLCLKATDNNSLKAALINLKTFEPNRERLAGFLHYLADDYQVTGDWKNPTLEHIDAMTQRLVTLSHHAA